MKNKIIIYFLLFLSLIINSSCNIGDFIETETLGNISAKEITSYSFKSLPAYGFITGTDISVTVPFGTPLTNLAASFKTTGDSVMVGSMTQISGSTVNDFTNPVIYKVIARDDSTMDYTVTVTVEAAPVPVNFTGLTANGVSTSVTTTELTLTFDADPDTITLADISLAGATASALTGTGFTRTLTISGILVPDSTDVTLTLTNPPGYTITPSSRNTQVFVSAVVYNIGDIGPSGVGIVFYVYNGGINGLEAAPDNWNAGPDPEGFWKNTNTLTNGTSTGLLTGYENTYNFMIGIEHPAADLCRTYTGGGLNDWSLPSRDELNEIYVNRAFFPGMVGTYWTSSENMLDPSWAWAQLLSLPGTQYDMNGKTQNAYIRPIRRF